MWQFLLFEWGNKILLRCYAMNKKYYFPYKWKEEPKCDVLLEAIIRKDFKSAEYLLSQGMKLEDIDESTFKRALFEFLTDFDVMNFLVNHNFNHIYFDEISCIDSNNYIWGLYARAYFLKRMDVVELLCSAGFDLFSNGQYIVDNDGDVKGYPLWKHVFVRYFDKELLNLLLEYGYSRERILFYDICDAARKYLESKPKVPLKGYALGSYMIEPTKPEMPRKTLFMGKNKWNELLENYEYELWLYNEKVRERNKYLKKLTDNDWERIRYNEEVDEQVHEILKNPHMFPK